MIADCRSIAEWTGRPAAEHRDADVWRWAVAQRVALEVLRGEEPKSSKVQVQQIGRTEITTFPSVAAGGVASMKGIARKRSQAHGR